MNFVVLVLAWLIYYGFQAHLPRLGIVGSFLLFLACLIGLTLDYGEMMARTEAAKNSCPISRALLRSGKKRAVGETTKRFEV